MNTRRRQRGFTLAELLVAAAVFGVVMATAVGVMLAQRRALESGEVARASIDAGRSALVSLERSLRLAGFGVDPRFAFDFGNFRCNESYLVTGVDGRSMCRDRKDAPDRLSFVYRDPYYRVDTQGENGCARLEGCPHGHAWDLVARNTMEPPTITVRAREGDRFEAGRTLLVACSGGSRSTMVTVASNHVAEEDGPLVLGLKPTQADNPYMANELSEPCLDLASFVFLVERAHYEVRTWDGVPWLVLDRGLDLDGDGNDPWTTPDDDDLILIASDVENMQIAYVMAQVPGQPAPDSNGNWTTGDDPDAAAEEPDPAAAAPVYVTPADHPARFSLHPANVRAVRVSLTMRTARGDPGGVETWAGDRVPVLENAGATVPAEGLGRRRRHVVATSVSLRNLTSKGLFTF